MSGKAAGSPRLYDSVVRIRCVFQPLVYLLSVFQHWTRAHGACPTVEELQSQFDKQSASQETLMQRVSDEENMSVVREELHRQANYLRTLKSMNAKLTSELTVLREG